jgi:hypothetical protein
MAASLCGQLHTIKWLVKENNARVNGQDAHGCTALNLACRGGYPKVVHQKINSRTSKHVFKAAKLYASCLLMAVTTS